MTFSMGFKKSTKGPTTLSKGFKKSTKEQQTQTWSWGDCTAIPGICIIWPITGIGPVGLWGDIPWGMPILGCIIITGCCDVIIGCVIMGGCCDVIIGGCCDVIIGGCCDVIIGCCDVIIGCCDVIIGCWGIIMGCCGTMPIFGCITIPGCDDIIGCPGIWLDVTGWRGGAPAVILDSKSVLLRLPLGWVGLGAAAEKSPKSAEGLFQK